MEFACDKCPYTTKYRNALKGHIMAIHDRIKKFRCEHCEYAATLKQVLKKHVMAVHEKIKNYKYIEELL